MFYAENAGYENIVNIFKKKMEQTRIQRLNNNIKLENYNDVINLMKANDSGVPLKVKKYLFVTYNRVFEGSSFFFLFFFKKIPFFLFRL